MTPEEVNYPIVYLHEIHVERRRQRSRIGSQLMHDVKLAALRWGRKPSS